jgi:septum site-determining protein MinC
MSSVIKPQAMRLIGRSYMAFVLTPDAPIIEWLATVDAWLARSPGFFADRSIVLDLANVTLSRSGIRHLVANLLERGVRVMGLEGADTSELGPDLPPLLRSGRVAGEAIEIDVKPDPNPEPVLAAVPRGPASLLVDHPIRSGQTIYFPDGDVSVLGSVGSGAEIVAGGSIHVYGTLRGRAMAGSTGDGRARIFCQKIEAELLAINGYYKTADEIEDALRGRPTQAWLDGSMLAITALN